MPFTPLMFYFVSNTAISHVRSHFTHSHSVYRQTSLAYFAKLLQHKVNGGGVGVLWGVRVWDTDDTFHTNTFHTVSQHPTEADLHSF